MYVNDPALIRDPASLNEHSHVNSRPLKVAGFYSREASIPGNMVLDVWKVLNYMYSFMSNTFTFRLLGVMFLTLLAFIAGTTHSEL